MKIFVGKGDWRAKVNFVDENNVLLGFDNENDCCANGGWFLSDDKDKWENKTFKEKDMTLPGWVFDPSFFRERNGSEYEEGGAVQFRLTKGKKERFLVLYNVHNGYYGRGFWFTADGKTKEGFV
jgi:hypothetical protein